MRNYVLTADISVFGYVVKNGIFSMTFDTTIVFANCLRSDLGSGKMRGFSFVGTNDRQ